ncbi:hypothetical protein PN823_004471 [Enterobacter hormaechei]|nr:hypothetical protein [Enterobacter hormaechei]
MKKLMASFLVLAATATTVEAGEYKICHSYSTGETVTIYDEGKKFSILDSDLNVIATSPELNKQIRKNVFIGERDKVTFMRSPIEYSVKDDMLRKAWSFTNCKAVEADAPADAEESEDFETVSEVEMRGDIAKPEYKGANTFEGEAFYNGKESIGKVTLVRFANGDIKVIVDGKEHGVFKRDENIANIPNTYSEPRSETAFIISDDEYYSVVHTKLVK